jgi:sulfotransferase family protein
MQLERKEKHKRNEKLENLLDEINTILEYSEDKILKDYYMPNYPVVFIVGCARSGSTILLQWIASTGYFAYPTNLLSRFYAAPYIGAKIQQLLTDPQFNFRNELADFHNEIHFSSLLGKTQGTLAPNEFWYFWRRFFPYGEIQYLDEEALKKVNKSKFVSEMAAIEAAFDKPLVLKGLIINWNIPFLSSILDKVLFIHITRHPLYNSQSLLKARTSFFGSSKQWYSFKPIEYENLKDLDPFEQVAGQVYFTNRAIEKGLAQIDNSRWIKVRYEDFCKAPEKLFNNILKKFAKQGYSTKWNYTGSKGFKSTNLIRLNQKDLNKIIGAWKHFSGKNISINDK